MPQRFCTSSVDSGDECNLRNCTEIHDLLKIHAPRIKAAAGEKERSLGVLRRQTINRHPSPFWSILNKEHYIWHYGVCDLHLIYLGLGKLMLMSFANHHGAEWVQEVEERYSKNLNKPKSKIFFLTSNKYKAGNKNLTTKEKQEYRLSLSTAEEVEETIILGPSIMHDMLDDQEYKLLVLLLEIALLLGKKSYTRDLIDELEKKCFEWRSLFFEKYKNTDSWTGVKRTNLDLLVHFAQRYLGLAKSTSTKFYELIHRMLKNSNSNNKTLIKTAMETFERRRRNAVIRLPTILEPRVAAQINKTGKFKKLVFGKKQLREGNFIKFTTNKGEKVGQIKSWIYKSNQLLKLHCLVFRNTKIIHPKTNCETYLEKAIEEWSWEYPDKIEFQQIQIGQINSSMFFVNPYYVAKKFHVDLEISNQEDI